jgi:hypothetical protein
MNLIRGRFLPDLFVKHIFILFLFSTAVRLNAQFPDLRISLKANNKTVFEILEKISLQSGYNFTYDSELIPEKKKLSIDVQELPLEVLLDSLIQNPRLHYRLLDKNIIIYKKNEALLEISDSILLKPFQIKGSITDQSNGKPLPFANIALFGTNRGTITNTSGNFILNIPADITDPVLVISYVGYKNSYISVELPSEKSIDIKMKKDIVSLQEVIIRIKDPVYLLNECLKKIAENYLSEYSLMTGYYREYVKKNKDLMNFSEAVIEISKEPYHLPPANEKVRILKGRKIINSDVSDTILMKIKSGIYNCLELDVIKNLPDFLSSDFQKYYELSFSDIASYKNSLQYVIGFRQKDFIKKPLYRGSLNLDQKSLALQSADFEIDPSFINQESNMFIVRKSRGLRLRPVKAAYHVEYRQTNDKYYLSQVHAEVRFKLRNKKEWIASDYTINIGLFITSIEPGIRVKFGQNEQLRPGIIISEVGFEYDPEYWGSYDIVEPESSLKEALKRIGIDIEEFGDL